MQKIITYVLVLLCAIAVYSFAPKDDLTITSKSFKHNEMMPTKFSCEGENISPQLKVTGIPKEAKSLALIMHDPDAPIEGGFTHWVMWNIGTDGLIPEDFQGAKQGLNRAGEQGYIGMCPPSGTHHYHFNVYALDAKLGIDGATDKAGLEKAMQGHILAEGLLTGLYKKVGK